MCLNTVAVLFLLEVDNLAFLHGLGERTRREAEQHAHAGAHVTEDDLRTMGIVATICVVLILLLSFRRRLRPQRDSGQPRLSYSCGCPRFTVCCCRLRATCDGEQTQAHRDLAAGSAGAILNYAMFMSWYMMFYLFMFVQVHGRRAYAAIWNTPLEIWH